MKKLIVFISALCCFSVSAFAGTHEEKKAPEAPTAEAKKEAGEKAEEAKKEAPKPEATKDTTKDAAKEKAATEKSH